MNVYEGLLLLLYMLACLYLFVEVANRIVCLWALPAWKKFRAVRSSEGGEGVGVEVD